jgi:hypothetical protein
VPQLQDLLAEVHPSASARRQIDRPHRHLCRKAKSIGRSRSVRHDHLAALSREGHDSLLNRRRPDAEPTHNRPQIDTAAGTDELSALGQARQSLIHRGAISKVEQALRGYRRTLWERPGMGQNLFAQSLHRLSPVRNISDFLTLLKEAIRKAG